MCNDVDNAYSIFHDMFDQACNLHCPVKQKRIQGSFPDWITSEYIKLSKDRDHYYSKAHKTNNANDWMMARKLRNQVNKLNKTLKKNYCNDAINNNKNNSKTLWSTIRKLIPKNVSSVTNVQTKNGFTCNDIETANQFNNYFTSIGNTLADKFRCNANNSINDLSNTKNNGEHDDFNFDVITPDFVYNQICKFSTGLALTFKTRGSQSP
jgi:hypothetical protein